MQLVRAQHLQTRSIDSFTDSPGLTEQLAEIQGIHLDTWNAPSIREALSVPAVFRAVSLIANTAGSLLMQAFRDGTLMPDQPTLVSRPGLDGTPREFWRDTAYGLATRGRFIWLTVDRDFEDRPRKLLLLPSREVTVEFRTDLPWVRKYTWRGKELDLDDVTHGTLIRDEWGLDGMGPLQVCGAALSAAVEAEEWAARFFAKGGAPATLLKYPTKLAEDEAKALKAQWLETEGNEVKIADMGLEPEPFQISPEAAQLLGSRKHSTGNVATMFGINGHLLNYAESGSSLTYQNIGEVFVDFVRSSLAPNYLVPIEDAITNLLPRSQVARFNTQELYRADLRTRADVFKTLIDAQMPQEQALEMSGFDVSAELQPIPSLDGDVSVTIPRA